ncbi:carbamoyl-phosphate synth [Anaeromyces robustus]|uniref:Carbamoyl-phosphate synth n=1 Tax=Anaeromyces robustus TaxID=1754192 RepID=A0A1Y1WRZ8_9FUNG|nr:carbamoyl-phosphate synth [Anaeromyces robustus]|eukprot:ORX76323.1 carbamoyl-phosphate synth [Anaeromyces robustus]
MPSAIRKSIPHPPVHAILEENPVIGTLYLKDNTAFQGISFGAKHSIAGECVFQTGMVGYPESLTDPSYRGQILVLTFPLVGNYGVPSREEVEKELNNLPKYFESSRIHVAGLIIGQYSLDYSHYLAKSSLADWLIENDVPALYGIDTRALTKKIRKQDDVEWHDPNTRNLVAEVSTKEIQYYKADPSKAVKGPDGKTIQILVIDVGMKNNQIRCFVNRGVDIKVVPWDYDFLNDDDYDAVFVSNGPGDPSSLKITIEHLRAQIKKENKPMFGICLGHQLISLAAGATTRKMKFGNRGHNIPCTDMKTGRCYITSQNHGYAVDVKTLPEGWKEYFVNANDASNEGIYHETLPYFSVQFHPEATPGPKDTEYLFDDFISVVKECKSAGKLVSLQKKEKVNTPKRVNIRKVLILGSGGLSIGQAGEFDYSGSQAIKAFKEEGIYTILINPNIATIQTSQGLADKIYFLPVTADFVRKVIRHEKPDGICCTFGGQTALNVGVKLKDEFEGLGVKVLGTPIETIEMTEDRELFAQALYEINEKCAKSEAASSLEEAIEAANRIQYPLIIRAAYTLGGLGSGFAENEEQLRDICNKAFATSPQVLVERSMKGWKEIEYEVVRDINDNCVTVCNMENFDPLGIHTGDSIVVAPSQTLSDEDYMMLRNTAINVVRHLGVIGECNIQYALNPQSKEYCIIEVNARLSRSSALASKATGYPLAFVAAKLALGIPLTEVMNNVTKSTIACFEPSLDYCIVKIPRWDLKKFNRVSTKISSSMKSVGEVMAIGRTFEETIQKAIRAVDDSFIGFGMDKQIPSIEDELIHPSDQRLFAIGNAFHKGYTVDKIWELTRIDKWFLNKLKNIVDLEQKIANYTTSTIPKSLLLSSKQLGFSDVQLGKILQTSELAIRKLRMDYQIKPFVKQIDTVAAEFPCYTNYLYMTYNAVEHDISFNDHGVMVLGSGVYRIGSSVEFDWCAVRAIRTLRENHVKTIMVNYNPETVSTDYDEADRLYFETLTLERVLDIYEVESSEGVIISMGGQTPNNIALRLHRQNVKILGTSPEMIDNAENRYKFSRMLDKIGVDQPQWKELTSIDEAGKFCESVGYPVLVRPSYVLSGAAMNVVYSENDLQNFLEQATAVSREYPVVITKYIEEAKEIEMDAVAVNGKLIMHVISEHVENAGVHSGDATLVLPPQDLDPETIKKLENATRKIGNALNVTGPYNIQFIAKNNEIKVIECNVRSSRSFPFVSKVVGIDLIELATKVMLNLPIDTEKLENVTYDRVAVKVPQFSFSRLTGADPVLGVEMASTGEVACFGDNKYEAYLKALLSTGFTLPKKNILLSIGSYKEKVEFLPSVKRLHEMGFQLFATSGTADFIHEHGIPVKYLEAIDNEKGPYQEYSLSQHLSNNLIDLYINLPSKNRFRRPASYISTGYKTRRMAVDLAVPLITNVKCAKLFVEALSRKFKFDISSNDFKTSHHTAQIPGLINVQTFFNNLSKTKVDEAQDFTALTKGAIAGGFTISSLMPIGDECVLSNSSELQKTHNNCHGKAYCDYILNALATPTNIDEISNIVSDTTSLLIPLNEKDPITLKDKMAEIIKFLNDWPSSFPVVADAKNADLAAFMFLADLQDRAIHITNVTTEQDISLIAMSKEKGLKVTCDVNVYNLFLSNADFDSKYLSSPSDVEALWNHIEVIDCFSVGATPFYVAKENGHESTSAGIEEALPLLLTAVNDGRLTLDDIVNRLYHNPRRIFEIPEQANTYVEIELDRKIDVVKDSFETSSLVWSALEGKTLYGHVHRTVIRGQTVYLDGAFFPEAVKGRDLSAIVNITNTPHTPKETTLISPPAMMTEPKSILRAPRSQYIADLPNSLSSIFGGASPFYKQHILSVRQFDRDNLHLLFGVAQEMRTVVERQGYIPLLTGRILCTAFYEPSTRTCSSFETAMLRLGGSVVPIKENTSSVTKGETLQDTIRTVGMYADVIALRHKEAGAASLAAKYSNIPIINAGDGTGEHPTQAFLDAFTIREELGTLNNLTITLVGDLKNGRTVHSLCRLLSNYQIKINYVSPESLRMPKEIIEELNTLNIPQKEFTDLNEVIADTDVLYVTRIQKERFENEEDYKKVFNSYVINNSVLSNAKSTMIVMHPLPRVNEISPEVDFDPRAAYFRQMKYGLYVRMALLSLVLGKRTL